MLATIYLVFNAGYGPPVRREFCAEAIRLALLLATLMPDEAEVHGLHALLLFQDARRDARVSSDGKLVLLDDQDRSLWDGAEIEQGRAALDRGLALRVPALICSRQRSRHSIPRTETDWSEVAMLYARLAQLAPSPVVDLNLAVAVAMAHGPEEGLALADSIEGLDDYYLLHSTRADFSAASAAWTRPAPPTSGRFGWHRARSSASSYAVACSARLDGLLGSRGAQRPLDLPPRLEHDHRPAEREREADLGQRPVAPTDRDHGVAGGHDGEVPAVPDPGDDHVVDPRVRTGACLAGHDPDRRAAGRLRAACRRRHHLAEASRDDGRAALGQEAADLFGAPLVLGAAADHRDLSARHRRGC